MGMLSNLMSGGIPQVSGSMPSANSQGGIPQGQMQGNMPMSMTSYMQPQQNINYSQLGVNPYFPQSVYNMMNPQAIAQPTQTQGTNPLSGVSPSSLAQLGIGSGTPNANTLAQLGMYQGMPQQQQQQALLGLGINPYQQGS